MLPICVPIGFIKKIVVLGIRASDRDNHGILFSNRTPDILIRRICKKDVPILAGKKRRVALILSIKISKSVIFSSLQQL